MSTAPVFSNTTKLDEVIRQLGYRQRQINQIKNINIVVSIGIAELAAVSNSQMVLFDHFFFQQLMDLPP